MGGLGMPQHCGHGTDSPTVLICLFRGRYQRWPSDEFLAGMSRQPESRKVHRCGKIVGVPGSRSRSTCRAAGLPATRRSSGFLGLWPPSSR